MGTDNMPLSKLNHVSYVCESVTKSEEFYEGVLGFGRIKRPSSLKFEGAWLVNHQIGIGIHLIEKKDAQSKKGEINPKDNHIAFQCTDMGLISPKLKEMNIQYKKNKIKDDEGTVEQVFFHDPDGNMIEICNCKDIPMEKNNA